MSDCNKQGIDFGLKSLPLYRPIYIMGTRSSKGYREKKTYDFPDFWKGMKGL